MNIKNRPHINAGLFFFKSFKEFAARRFNHRPFFFGTSFKISSEIAGAPATK